MTMLLSLLLNNSCFSCPRKSQLLLQDKKYIRDWKSSVKLLFCIWLLNGRCGNCTARRKPSTAHGQLCSSHLSTTPPACTTSATQPSSHQCWISHSCHLPPSTISPPTTSILWGMYMYSYTQSLCSSVLPLKGENVPSQLHPLGRGLLTHPKVFGVNLQLGGMFLA